MSINQNNAYNIPDSDEIKGLDDIPAFNDDESKLQLPEDQVTDQYLMQNVNGTFVPTDTEPEVENCQGIYDNRCTIEDKPQIFTEYLSSNNNLISILRIRPPSTETKITVDFNDTEIDIVYPDSKERHETYHQIFGPGDSNDYIYSYIDPIIKGIIYGEKNTIMCYGGRKSGKSYTIGDVKRQGMLVKAMEFLFQKKEQSNSLIEITCCGICVDERDVAFDRFSKDGTGILKIKKGQDIKWEELTAFKFEDAKQFFTAISNTKKAMMRVLNRTVIYMLNYVEHSQNGIIEGSITFVNFIASNFLKPSQGLNKTSGSIQTLFKALAEKREKIPYEDSMLSTVIYSLLKQQGRVVMIGHIEPNDTTIGTTNSVLNFLTSFGLELDLGFPTKKYIKRNIWDEDKTILTEINSHIENTNNKLIKYLKELEDSYYNKVLKYKKQAKKLLLKDQYYQECNSNINQENDSTKSKIVELIEDYKDESDKLSRQKSDFKWLHEEISKLNRKSKDLINIYSELREQNSKLLRNNENCAQEKQGKIDELNHLNIEYSSLRNEVELLNKHHMSLENKKLKSKKKY